MSREHYPYLSPKPFAEFEAEEFREYVRSLYEAPVKKVPLAYSFKKTSKGAVSVTVRRKPQWLTQAEVAEVARCLVVTEEEVRTYLRKRKIPEVADATAGAALREVPCEKH